MKTKYAEDYVGITSKEYEELDDRHKKVFKIFSQQTFKKSLIKNVAHTSQQTLGKFDRILDVGCGDGNFSILLKEISGAKEVYGIEMSIKGMESARKNGVKVFQLDMDVEDFPFEDNYFDAIFAGDIIEHVFDPDHFLDEVYRTLREGGLCVVTTPNLASIHNRIALLFGYLPFPMGVSTRHNIGRLYEVQGDFPQSADHVRVFTLRSLKALAKITGFTIIDIKGTCAALPDNMRFSFLISTMDKVISLLPSLSYGVIVCCTKDEPSYASGGMQK
jgi:ubiquinone/menaquinone biosynthesis C-methylase UbiE